MKQPLIVIVGETGSGKSVLAMELARQFNGEIIAADSRTVYRGMDLGTAKPTPEDQQSIRHHLLDIADPDQQVTAADFKKQAQKAIEDITNRGKMPIMAGGSGLYIDSVLYDYKFRNPPQNDSRDYLAGKSVQELQLMLLERGIQLPNNPQNPRHLIRALETDGLVSVKNELRPETLIIGLQNDREELRHRLGRRLDTILEAGLVQEARELAGKYGWDIQAMQAPAYKALRGYIEGEQTLQEAGSELIKNELQLAKRQRTWFKRNKSIHWFSTPVNQQAVVDLVTTFLNK